MNALKGADPSVSQTVLDLDPMEQLLQQTVVAIATTYQADCALWVGLEEPLGQRIYSIRAGQHNSAEQNQTARVEIAAAPVVLPAWMVEQRRSPHLTQLDSGDLVVPVVWSQLFHPSSPPTAPGMLQLLLQLQRPEHSTAAATTAPDSNRWSTGELTALTAQSQELGLLYSALYCHQRLHQSRQQIALLGRVAQLLNSSLNTDEVVEQVIAELGQALGCDRCFLIRLQEQQANVMSYWEVPDQDLPPTNPDVLEQVPWRAVEEAFVQEGVSYLQVPAVTPGLDTSGLDVEPAADLPVTDLEINSLHACLNNLEATSALIIPVFIQAEFFGVIGLLSYQPLPAYRLEELQTARQIADHLAIALTNAQHHQQLWQRHDALRLRNLPLQGHPLRDELTQLLNREALDRELEHLSSRALWTVQPPFSIIFCDLDYFKLINDTHGYQTGNIILQNLAQRFQKHLRQETPAYRYDGEEFVVLLAETTVNHALDVAERLRRAIHTSPVETSSGSIAVTASFGIAHQDPSRDRDAYSVLHRAEQALREAKCQGRDCVKVL